ncbi:MAG: anthranilate phosphoribosyltransferase [Bryobacteraceae bacterium]
MPILDQLHRVCDRHPLSPDEAQAAMESILSGEASHAQIGAFLAALRMKGETVEELVGFARAMRKMAQPVRPNPDGPPLVDTCGTGGDNASTFNISTVTALVLAGAGLRVAKHGNRSISSHTGSADLLERLGVKIALTGEQMARSIDEVGIGFLFAPAVHPAMKNAQPVRVELKMRTVFNLLGPLTNPAGAKVQLVGAPSVPAARMMAEALAALGLDRGFVVHGADGLDEVSTTGATEAFEIERGFVRERVWYPEDFGVARARLADLQCPDRDSNVRIAREVLQGGAGPRREIVLVNASAALVAAGVADSFPQGIEHAARAIDSGEAWAKVLALAEFTRSV